MYCIPLGRICVLRFYAVRIIVFLACDFFELRVCAQVQIDTGLYAIVVFVNCWCVHLNLVILFGGLGDYVFFGIGMRFVAVCRLSS